MPNRHKSSGSYRYGFGGHEKDDELKGEGNHYDFGNYGYDPRVSRRFQVDPLIANFSSNSSYSVFNDNPIYYVDPSGMSPDDWVRNKETGKYHWDGNATSPETTQEGYEYVGKSTSDVVQHFEENHPILSFFKDLERGEDLTTPWPGEVTEYVPDFWDRQRDGNIAQQIGYETLNGFYTTGQLFMGRSVGLGTMKNLDGTQTTTDQAVLGFSEVGSAVIGSVAQGAKAVKIAVSSADEVEMAAVKQIAKTTTQAARSSNLVKIGEISDDVIVFSSKFGDEVVEGIANFKMVGDKLHLNGLHLQGSSAGQVGRSNMWNMAKDLGKQFNAKEVIIQGGKRTTGKYKGTVPSPITIKVN